MKYFFVNLGRCYKAQRQGEFLWAPIYNERGERVSHWESMEEVSRGDIIFCNRNAHIVSIAIAKSSAYLADIPVEFDNLWNSKGRKVDLQFIDLDTPFSFSKYKSYYLKNINSFKNPFTVKGNAKQGYLFLLDDKIAHYFLSKIDDRKLQEFIDKMTFHIIDEKEEMEEELEQFEKIHNGSVRSYTEAELEIINKVSYQYCSSNHQINKKFTREKTDPKLKATRLEKAHFLCEIDPSHKTFLNASGNYPYMECHHIVPLKAQRDFENIKLDHLYNLIAICPTCHRRIHYANREEKEKIFFEMYAVRKNELEKIGFTRDKMISIFNSYY